MLRIAGRSQNRLTRFPSDASSICDYHDIKLQSGVTSMPSFTKGGAESN